MRPEIIVADEPTAGLDVSVQGELLNLLLDLQREFGLTYLLVSHNLNVIRRVTGRTAVMYLGQIVEEASTRELFDAPAHPYSAALLSTNPAVDPRKRVQPIVLQGRNSERRESTGRLPVPHALSGGAAEVQRPIRHCFCRSKASGACAATFRSRSTAGDTDAARLSKMPSIDLTYLNGPDVAALALTDDEILAAVEGGLRAQGLGQTVLEPRVHLVPESSAKGHFNVLRGVVAPLGVAGVKVVGDFVDNWKQGLPSELAVLTLFDPAHRRAARHSRCVGADRHAHGRHVRARRQAPRAARCEGARPHRRARHRVLERPAHRPALRLLGDSRALAASREPPRVRRASSSHDLGKPVVATDDWESCVRGADIVVEASRLPEPQPLLRTEWIKPGALVIPYGTMSAVEITLTDIMAKIVVDDWGQCRKGMPFGALRRHVDEGRLHEGNLHAELGQIVAGLETRAASATTKRSCSGIAGCRLSDIALGCALLDKAKRMGCGQTLRFQ